MPLPGEEKLLSDAHIGRLGDSRVYLSISLFKGESPRTFLGGEPVDPDYVGLSLTLSIRPKRDDFPDAEGHLPEYAERIVTGRLREIWRPWGNVAAESLPAEVEAYVRELAARLNRSNRPQGSGT